MVVGPREYAVSFKTCATYVRVMTWPRTVTIAVLLVLSLVLIPGVAAQETRSGGNVVVPAGETVQDLTVTAGTATISGTIDGDLTVFAGDINIDGNVTGDATAMGGSVTISGNVAGNASVVSGYLELSDTGSIGQSLSAAAGDVFLNGTVVDDARIDAERLVVGPSADIGGDLAYATQSLSLSDAASVGGDIRSVDRIDVTSEFPAQTNVPFWALSIYGFLVNLILGLILLFIFPERSFRIADLGLEQPLLSVVIGFLTLLVTPVILVLLTVTIIGIPLALIGLFAFLLAVWAGSVYGAFTVGAWILGYFDVTNRWLILFVGLVAVFILGAIPFLGGAVHFLVMLLGLGALVSGAR